MSDSGGPPRSAWLLASGATLATVLVVEAVGHGPYPPQSPFSVALLVGALLAPVFVAFRVGMVAGIASALAIGVYAIHYFSPHRAVLPNDGGAFLNAFLFTVVGTLIAAAVGALKAREDRRTASVLDTERAHARSVEDANRELRRANDTLQAFSYVVGHDLKEPVRAVATYLEAARESWGTPAALAYVEHAESANARMASLLRGLLDWSRVALDASDLTNVSVEEVLSEAQTRAQFEHLLKERDADLVVASDAPEVAATPALVRQVFGNLIVNALKHASASRPEVEVHAEPSNNGYVDFLVDDNGAGFPPHVLKLYAAGTPARDASSAGGFGLLIARRAVQRAGGDLFLESTPQGGARVRVRFRTARASAEQRLARRVSELV